MSKREDYESRTEKLLEPIVAEWDFEIVDVEYVKEGSNWYLRAYIDKPGGITIDDLEKVSRILSDKLDEEDFISDAYILEVSSPGLGRPLKKEKDFERSIGEEVEVFLYKAINKQKQFVGLLKSYNNEGFTIETESGEEMEFNKKEVALVRLSIDF
ncbi:MAG: ribosome maturation factor RimP [Lachnospiraceae bacterium]|nr:ribosome maturation factor RimP [Lachnospiraceae bacterium]